MNLFREVKLPLDVSGKLLLHTLPGRWEPITDFLAEINLSRVTTIVSLVSNDEILRISPEYARAIMPPDVEQIIYPIKDFGIPDDIETFVQLINNIVIKLVSGRNVLAHCFSGRGRSGIFGTCVAVSLGANIIEARQMVSQAKAKAGETIEQQKFVDWYATMNFRNSFPKITRK